MKIKYILCFFICIAMIFICGCSQDSSHTAINDSEINDNDSSYDVSSDIIIGNQGNKDKIDNNLSVHFIDVGQGDAVFVELPNRETMLIDAGEKKYSDKVVKYIENLGYETVSYIVGTHPHSDHIGGLEDVINSFKINSIFMPKISTNTKTFESLLLTIKNKGLKITTAKKDVKIIDKKDLTATILSPIEEKYSNLNNYSVVIMLEYKSRKFMFTGDAEEEVENALKGYISCDVLKVGHHGSSSSTSNDFLKKLSPKYAVISCGKGNIYGHPHKETLEKLNKIGAEYMTTENCGNIVIVTDGNKLDIRNERADVMDYSEYANKENIFMLNISTLKIHYPECKAVSRMSEDNKKKSTDNVLSLEEQGYTRCGICKPE